MVKIDCEVMEPIRDSLPRNNHFHWVWDGKLRTLITNHEQKHKNDQIFWQRSDIVFFEPPDESLPHLKNKRVLVLGYQCHSWGWNLKRLEKIESNCCIQPQRMFWVEVMQEYNNILVLGTSQPASVIQVGIVASSRCWRDDLLEKVFFFVAKEE